MNMTSLDSKKMFYDEFAPEFDNKMNMYDTNKRLRIIFDELITEDLHGKLVLDAGSGTGWFSKRACERGAEVTSMDVGEKILSEVEKKCHSKRVVGDVLNIDLASESFDFVMCTEVIEHTTSPLEALSELQRVLKPGGVLILTVPNRIWHFSVSIANTLKLRPYEGYENWVGWFQLKRKLASLGFSLDSMRGFHLFPFVLPISYPVLDFFDNYGRQLGPVMLNIAVRARKPVSREGG